MSRTVPAISRQSGYGLIRFAQREILRIPALPPLPEPLPEPEPAPAPPDVTDPPEWRPVVEAIIDAVRGGARLDAAIREAGVTPSDVAGWLESAPELQRRLSTAADMWAARRTVRITEEKRRAASRWRAGERTEEARAGKRADERARRRELSAAVVPLTVRRSILDQVAAGGHLYEVSEAHGVTVAALFGRAKWDTEWRRQLDEALTRGRRRDISHGVLASYRRHRCRCPECRAAKARDRSGGKD